jgi:hypothetical protein
MWYLGARDRMLNWIKLRRYKEEALPVRVTTSDSEEYRGFVLDVNANFLMVVLVSEWHTDGVGIFPLGEVRKCEADVDFSHATKILLWLGVDLKPNYSWVSLESFPQLFSSVQSRDKAIYLSDRSSAEVGVVVSIERSFVKMRGIDAQGDWLQDEFEFKYDEMVQIVIDDEYSTVLWKYALANPT